MHPIDPLTALESDLKDWGPFGSTICHQAAAGTNFRFVDLRPLTQPVVPVTLPAFLHFYWAPDGVGIESTAGLCLTHRCRGYKGLDEVLAKTPGIKYLLYVQDISDQMTGPDAWHARFGTIKQSEHVNRALFKPRTVRELLTGPHPRPVPLGQQIDRSMYPHSCPRCGGPAYIGLNNIDCMRSCA